MADIFGADLPIAGNLTELCTSDATQMSFFEALAQLGCISSLGVLIRTTYFTEARV